jgi:hypothetical protein
MREARDLYVRLNHAAARHPVLAVLIGGVVVGAWIALMSGNLGYAVLFAVSWALIWWVASKSSWKQEQFARWAETHPDPARRA